MTVGASLSNNLNNLFYIAIMDEDTEGIRELSAADGGDYFIEIFHVTQRKVFWKIKPQTQMTTCRVNSILKLLDGSHLCLPGLVLPQALSTYPLHLAAMHRKLESMKSLLLAGADPEKRDKQGRTTLHLVITSWPRFLTSAEESSNVSPFQAVLIGVLEKAEACLKLLCHHGVDINAEVTGVNKETALHMAVSSSAVSAVKILTSYRAEVNVVDGVGMTALHRAAGTLNKDIILHLIQQGADINVGVQDSGNTPLHIAVNVCATMTAKPNKKELHCITALLESGADPNAFNNQNLTPLHEACCLGCTELVDLLLCYGGDINVLNKDGESCLFMFLNKGAKLTNSHLLGKLFGLTTPLVFHNRTGALPASLMLPYSSKLKDPILKLAQEPRSLKSICKAFIYLQHVRYKKEWKQILPSVLYEYVFNEWDDLDKIFSDANCNASTTSG